MSKLNASLPFFSFRNYRNIQKHSAEISKKKHSEVLKKEKEIVLRKVAAKNFELIMFKDLEPYEFKL